MAAEKRWRGWVDINLVERLLAKTCSTADAEASNPLCLLCKFIVKHSTTTFVRCHALIILCRKLLEGSRVLGPCEERALIITRNWLDVNGKTSEWSCTKDPPTKHKSYVSNKALEWSY